MRRTVVIALLLTSPAYAEPDLSDPDIAAQELQREVANAVPGGWTVSAPKAQGEALQMTLYMPERWRGSPLGAAIAACPNADSDVWRIPALRDMPLLRLIVRLHGRDLAPYDCRP